MDDLTWQVPAALLHRSQWIIFLNGNFIYSGLKASSDISVAGLQLMGPASPEQSLNSYVIKKVLDVM